MTYAVRVWTEEQKQRVSSASMYTSLKPYVECSGIEDVPEVFDNGTLMVYTAHGGDMWRAGEWIHVEWREE